MKTSLFLSAAVALLAASVSAQDPIGPLTTNNAQSACVQYGDCTALPAGNTASTATQYGPVTAPASSQAFSAPTNAAETAASLSRLAETGAAAAFSNLSQGNDGAGGPASRTGTLTGGVIVGSSTSSASATRSNAPNAAVALGAGQGSWAWVVGGPLGAAAFGALMLAI